VKEVKNICSEKKVNKEKARERLKSILLKFLKESKIFTQNVITYASLAHFEIYTLLMLMLDHDV
jgi:regulator of sigma D